MFIFKASNPSLDRLISSRNKTHHGWNQLDDPPTGVGDILDDQH